MSSKVLFSLLLSLISLDLQPIRGGGGWPRPDVPLLENYEHKRQVQSSLFLNNAKFSFTFLSLQKNGLLNIIVEYLRYKCLVVR